MSTTQERSVQRGLSEKAERVFKRASFAVVTILGIGWAYSIGEARTTGDKVNLVGSAPAADVSAARSAGATDTPTVSRSVIGESGKLRARIELGERPGIVKAAVMVADVLNPLRIDFHFITPRPASEKRKGRIGDYLLGNWPKARFVRKGAVDYSPPNGFIEVTQSNQTTNVSEHFRLRDFLTKDQRSVWPKYVVVNLKLVDKLELILDDLKSRGINPDGVRVMSGFRTPSYNANGGDRGGRSSVSRHMYGDAADVFIDNTGNGAMDDLNGDGKVDIRDARIIADAAERVERAHPSLIGGIGVYAGTSAHGPFVHIDTRGHPARW